MANDLKANPIILDTDFISFAALWKTLTTEAIAPTAWRIRRLMLCVGAGGAATAGLVTINQNASGSRLLYMPMVVGTQAANVQIVTDGPYGGDDVLAWADFAVTGLTATGTRLFLWLRNS
jgi:hypothetical protein